MSRGILSSGWVECWKFGVWGVEEGGRKVQGARDKGLCTQFETELEFLTGLRGSSGFRGRRQKGRVLHDLQDSQDLHACLFPFEYILELPAQQSKQAEFICSR